MDHRPSGPGGSRNVRLAIGLITIAALAIIILAIAQQSRPRATGPSATGPLPAGPARPAPDVEITMYQGQDAVGGSKVRLSQVLAKGKPVVLNFFAGLCPPCRAEMPDFQHLYDAGGKDRFVLLSVDIGPFVGLGSRDEGKALLRELGITFPAGTVFDEDILGAYQILGMPTTVFITTDGRILRKHTGLLTPDQMRAFSEELIKVSQ